MKKHGEPVENTKTTRPKELERGEILADETFSALMNRHQRAKFERNTTAPRVHPQARNFQ